MTILKNQVLKDKDIGKYEILNKIFQFISKKLIDRLPNERQNQIEEEILHKCCCAMIKYVKENNITEEEAAQIIYINIASTRHSKNKNTIEEVRTMLKYDIDNYGNQEINNGQNWNSAGIWGIVKHLGYGSGEEFSQSDFIKEALGCKYSAPKTVLQNYNVINVQKSYVEAFIDESRAERFPKELLTQDFPNYDRILKVSSFFKERFNDEDILWLGKDKLDEKGEKSVSITDAFSVKEILEKLNNREGFDFINYWQYLRHNTYKDDTTAKGSNVNSFIWGYFEFDEGLTLEEQFKFITSLKNLPIDRITYSGGKSLHCVYRVDAESLEEYKIKNTKFFQILEKILIEKYGSSKGLDMKINDITRYDRLPWAKREIFDYELVKHPEYKDTTNIQFVIENLKCYENNYTINDFLALEEQTFVPVVNDEQSLEKGFKFSVVNEETDDVECNYKISSKGIYKFFKDGKGNEKVKRICTHGMKIIAGLEEGDNISYLIEYNIGDKIEKTELAATVIKSTKDLIKANGKMSINSDNSLEMVKFFENYIDHYQIKKKLQPGTKKLLIDDNGLFAGYNSPIIVRNKELLNALKPVGDKGLYMNFIKDIWQNASKIYILELLKLGISICTHLKSEITAIFELVGKSETGKSMLMKLRISLYGNPANDGGIMHSTNGTDKSFEKIFEKVGFLPAEIDEFEIMRQELINRKTDVNKFFYAWTQCTGRRRLNKNKETDDYDLNNIINWKTIVNITTEKTALTDNLPGGTLNRTITAYYNPKDRYNFDIDFIKENYGWFMQELVDSNLFSKDKITKEIKEFDFNTIKGYSKISEKQQEFFRYLAYSLTAYKEILGENEYYPEDFIEYFRTKDDIDTDKQIIEKIYNSIYQDRFHFYDLDPQENDYDNEGNLKENWNSNPKANSAVYGVFKDDYIYVSSKWLQELANKEYKTSFNEIKKILINYNLLERQGNGKYSDKFKNNNLKFQCYKLKKDSYDNDNNYDNDEKIVIKDDELDINDDVSNMPF